MRDRLVPLSKAYDHSHKVSRQKMLEGDPLCVHCGVHPATVADHNPPLVIWDTQNPGVPWEGEYLPSCRPCSNRQGGELGSRRLMEQQGYQTVEFTAGDDTAGPASDIWKVPWLAGLIDSTPSDAVWPRYMTAPHPDAVGSYGEEFEAHVLERTGSELYWWQRLVARRILEHDDDGKLVWMRWLFTVARQLGKSHLIRELLVWITKDPRRFFNADSNLLLSRKVGAAESVMRPAVRWVKAEEPDGWDALNSQGRMSITFGKRYDCFVKSTLMAYGETTGMAVTDECWDVAEAEITEGVEPTVVASEGQLGFTSTAHRLATSLTLNLRREAFDTMIAPDDLLLIEWSAPADCTLADEDAWRMASPRWTERRAKLMRKRLKAALDGEQIDESEPDPIEAFKAQWLNIWPMKHSRRGPGEDLVNIEDWAPAMEPSNPPKFELVASIEDNYGDGLAVVLAGLTGDEKIGLQCWLFRSRREAFAKLGELGADKVLVSAGLVDDVLTRDIVGFVEIRGAKEFRNDAATFRSLLQAGHLVHSGDEQMANQFLSCRIRKGTAGMVVASKERYDIVRAGAWAAAKVDQDRGTVAQVF